MFLNFLQDLDNYEDRKVGRIDREENGGIGVSTAYTSDEGYETALLDKNGIHPVERYETKEQAESGHKKWIQFAKTGNGKKINKLSWSDFDMDKEIVLKNE